MKSNLKMCKSIVKSSRVVTAAIQSMLSVCRATYKILGIQRNVPNSINSAIRPREGQLLLIDVNNSFYSPGLDQTNDGLKSLEIDSEKVQICQANLVSLQSIDFVSSSKLGNDAVRLLKQSTVESALLAEAIDHVANLFCEFDNKHYLTPVQKIKMRKVRKYNLDCTITVYTYDSYTDMRGKYLEVSSCQYVFTFEDGIPKVQRPKGTGLYRERIHSQEWFDKERSFRQFEAEELARFREKELAAELTHREIIMPRDREADR